MGSYIPLPGNGHNLSRPTRDAIAGLARDATVTSVTIFDYELDSLQPLGALARLEVLKIMNPRRITSLSGLTSLSQLRHLALSTPPGSDGSGRCIDVESLRPLAALDHLETLWLMGIRPRDLDLSPIADLRGLKELDIGCVPEFDLEHYARLAAALPTTEGRCLQPYCSIQGIGRCKRCDGKTVLLTGAPRRARHWLCPSCNAKKLAEHVQRWNEIRTTAATGGR
jgi:hypothetical protein